MFLEWSGLCRADEYWGRGTEQLMKEGNLWEKGRVGDESRKEEHEVGWRRRRCDELLILTRVEQGWKGFITAGNLGNIGWEKLALSRTPDRCTQHWYTARLESRVRF